MNIYFKIFLILLLLASRIIFAETHNKIKIIGNKNIDNEIIFSIIDEKITDYSTNNLNEIIKTLYETGNFKKVEIEKSNNEIILKIEENPSVDQIKFDGNKRFNDEEILEIFSKDKYFETFNLFNINNFIDELNNLYSSFGYNIIDIKYEVLKKDETDQLVDLLFIINEGSISKINRIFFIGNESYNDSKLRSLISSKQRNYLKLSRASNYKDYLINEDKRKIINFYKKIGFKNIEVEYKNEFIKKRNRLNVYFYINEGDQYYYRNIDFDLKEIYIENDTIYKLIDDEKNKLNNILLKTNNLYNPEIIIKSKIRLTKLLSKNGEFFFKFKVKEKIEENNVDIILKISEVEPYYVNNINIYGNTRTKEKVIRREITLYEGDPFNEEQLSISKKNIQRLGFFKSVKINDEKINDQIDINVEVEEKSTGEFQIGLGIDSFEGVTLLSGLKEKNIYGDGRELNLKINTSSRNTIYSFGIVEPYIFNRDVDLIYDISFANHDRSSGYSYDLDEFSTNFGFKYALAENTSHRIILQYVLKDYSITSTSASDSIQKLSGQNADIILDNNINYSNVDSFMRPSQGTRFTYSNAFSPATNDDNGYIKNIINYSKYYPYKNNIFSFKTKLGNITSLQNKELSVDDKFSLGGRWLRGFDVYGVGPRKSTSSYIGGRNIIASKFDFDRPILGTSDNPIDLNLFTDIGTVFDNKVDPTYSTQSIRASYGFGLKFYSPIGPIGLTWGFPLLKEDHDIERLFFFNIGFLN